MLGDHGPHRWTQLTLSRRLEPNRARLSDLFGPPGWSHDDRRGDTRAVKADFLAPHPECAGQPGLVI